MGIVHVSKHDRYQIEIKSQMLVSQFGDNNEQVDMWLFLPPALGIAPAEYSHTQFYSDLRTYTRLKTPFFNIEDLLSSSESPLVLLERRIGQAPSIQVQRVLRQEIKLMTTIVRKIELPDGSNIPLGLLQTVLNRWRIVHSTLSQKTLLPKTIACLNIADEVLSNHWEMSLIDDNTDDVSIDRDQRLKEEVAYRESQGYLIYNKHKKDQYLFHYGNLVKYVSTVLYLDTKVDVSSRWLRHLAFGLAAGLAMVWALFVQIYALFRLGIDLGEGMSVHLIGTFVGIGIFSYILKDRIKATTGRWLTDLLNRKMPDRTKQFYVDDEEMPISYSDEKTRFVKVRDLPTDIQDVYQNFQEWNPYFMFGSDVLHYQQKRTTHVKLARKQFPRFRGVVHIHRFHVWNWIKTLAPPKKEIVVVNAHGKVERCKAPRIYTVNLMTKTTMGDHLEYKLFRILLNNRGVVAVEPVILTR